MLLHEGRLLQRGVGYIETPVYAVQHSHPRVSLELMKNASSKWSFKISSLVSSSLKQRRQKLNIMTFMQEDYYKTFALDRLTVVLAQYIYIYVTTYENPCEMHVLHYT